MGIASLILGILSFLISFSWFGDLSLILGILGGVLGVIAIVKKKGKGFGIAGVILSILALIILFSNPSNTDGKTGTGITTDNGNGTSKVSVSTENVKIEKVGITKSGDFVMKVTNNNEGSVCLSSISTIYKDANGNFVEKVETDSGFVCIPAKSSTLVYNWGYDKNFKQYPNYEFSCELANISESFIYDKLDITSNNTGKQIAVTVKNNNEKTLTDCRVVVAYYLNNEIVGISTGYSDATTASGSNAYINIEYPQDSNYNEVSFDKYEVFYINAGIN